MIKNEEYQKSKEEVKNYTIIINKLKSIIEGLTRISKMLNEKDEEYLIVKKQLNNFKNLLNHNKNLLNNSVNKNTYLFNKYLKSEH